jgi:hypothetical protein
MVGEVQRFLDRSVSTADHRNLLAAIEEAVARRARADALAFQRVFAVEPKPLGLCARRDNEHIAFVNVTAIADQAERTLAEIDLHHGVVHQGRPDMLGLLLHLLHQPGPLDDVGEAGVIFHIGGGHQLAAGLDALHENRSPESTCASCGWSWSLSSCRPAASRAATGRLATWWIDNGAQEARHRQHQAA